MFCCTPYVAVLYCWMYCMYILHIIHIIECDSTLYVGMTQKQNGGPIPRIYIYMQYLLYYNSWCYINAEHGVPSGIRNLDIQLQSI